MRLNAIFKESFKLVDKHRKWHRFFIFIFLLPLVPVGAEALTDPFRLQARQIESKGIGYNQGYSTVEVFYAATEVFEGRWLPMLDLQGHFFKNGRSALNAGLGIRYEAARVWGITGFYDYRNSFRGHYNQVSLGLESLGRIWDFRLSLYHPFGTKVHHFGSKKEFPLQMVAAEAGVHVRSVKNFPIYFAASPYFVHGEGKTAWGCKLRGSVDFLRHIRLEASTSFDHLYHWIGQGQLGIFFMFGGKKEGKGRSKLILQRMERFEVVPLFRSHA